MYKKCDEIKHLYEYYIPLFKKRIILHEQIHCRV